MEYYDEISFKEIKEKYEAGDIFLLDYLNRFIPDKSYDELRKLFIIVSDYNEIFANGFTISDLLKMGEEDKYWLDRANNFIKKYNVKKSQYNEHCDFFDKYVELRNSLLSEMGIDLSILELDVEEIPDKGFIDGERIMDIKDLNDNCCCTVARVFNFCHCVELHYNEGKAIIEYGTKKEYDFWENEIEDASWFNLNMSNDEIMKKLDQLFIEHFGRHEFVEKIEDSKKIDLEV